jgi:hypothetical protein
MFGNFEIVLDDLGFLGNVDEFLKIILRKNKTINVSFNNYLKALSVECLYASLIS